MTNPKAFGIWMAVAVACLCAAGVVMLSDGRFGPRMLGLVFMFASLGAVYRGRLARFGQAAVAAGPSRRPTRLQIMIGVALGLGMLACIAFLPMALEHGWSVGQVVGLGLAVSAAFSVYAAWLVWRALR